MRGPPCPVRPGGVAAVGSIGLTGAPPPLPSRPPLGAGLAGGAAGGWACDWPGWAGRVAGGAREPEHRGAGGGAEPAAARSCRSAACLARSAALRLAGATETFLLLGDLGTPPPRDSDPKPGSGAFGMAAPTGPAGT